MANYRIASNGLEFRQLELELKNNRLLQDVSGFSEPGTMLAIMGPSGAGKSTLLNVLAGRPPMLTSGEILLRGHTMSKQIRRKISYVMQEDILLEYLTVRQTLQYTALLRLPEAMSTEEKLARAEEVSDALDLGRCMDIEIGGTFNKGISGGQKKRTSIACELLTSPILLMLDEPTSGLDSSTAYNLMKTLQRYARTTNTILVASIHQPSSQTFYLFDQLLLLCDGQVAYFGDSFKVLDFFASLNLYIQPNYNAADFILERISDNNVKEQIVAAFKLKSDKHWTKNDYPDGLLNVQQKEADQSSDLCIVVTDRSSQSSSSSDLIRSEAPGSGNCRLPDETGEKELAEKWPTGFVTQYITLTRRNIKQTVPRIFSKWSIAQTLFMSLFAGVLWFQIPRTEKTIPERLGLCFFINTYWSFLVAGEAVLTFISERAVLLKERAAGYYRLSAYYLAKITCELPLTLLMPSASVALIYWMADLGGYVAFFKTWAVVLASALAAQSVGLFVGAAITDLNTAMTIENVTILVALLTGGFYVRNLPFWLIWIKYTSYLYYSFSALSLFAFRPMNLMCLPENETAYCASVYESLRLEAELLQGNDTASPRDSYANVEPAVFSGSLVLDSMGMVWPEWAYPVALVGWTLVLRCATYFVLRLAYRLK